MGNEFLPWDQILEYDTHVIVDARDGSIHKRKEHDAFQAMCEFLREDCSAEMSRNDWLQRRCSYDHMVILLSIQLGHEVEIAMDDGEVPEPYFTCEIPPRYMVIGPFYTLESCLHNKNMHHALFKMNKLFRDKDAREGLSDEEERIALEFDVYLKVSQSGKSTHPDHNGE